MQPKIDQMVAPNIETHTVDTNFKAIILYPAKKYKVIAADMNHFYIKSPDNRSIRISMDEIYNWGPVGN